MYEKVHELVWIKLNESKCTVKQWNLKELYVHSEIGTWHIIFKNRVKVVDKNIGSFKRSISLKNESVWVPNNHAIMHNDT